MALFGFLMSTLIYIQKYYTGRVHEHTGFCYIYGRAYEHTLFRFLISTLIYIQKQYWSCSWAYWILVHIWAFLYWTYLFLESHEHPYRYTKIIMVVLMSILDFGRCIWTCLWACMPYLGFSYIYAHIYIPCQNNTGRVDEHTGFWYIYERAHIIYQNNSGGVHDHAYWILVHIWACLWAYLIQLGFSWARSYI
jgi:hypothetical protein